MQEEVENRSVTLIISSTKLTARVLKAAIAKYLAHRKDKKISKARAGPVVPHGKQSVKELVGQNAGVSNLEIKRVVRVRDYNEQGRFAVAQGVKL